MSPRPPRSTLLPYTTLFRSFKLSAGAAFHAAPAQCRLCRRKKESRNLQEYSMRSDSLDRKSTRLNSSHASISYAVFCLKKKMTVQRGGGLRLASKEASLARP